MGRGGGGPTPPADPLAFATYPVLVNSAIQQGDTLEWTLGTTTGGDGSPITWTSQVQIFNAVTEVWDDYGSPVVGTSGLDYELLDSDIWSKTLRVNVAATQTDVTISAATNALTARNGFLDTFDGYSEGAKIYPVWSRLSNFKENWVGSVNLTNARTYATATATGFPSGKGISHTSGVGSGNVYKYGFDVGSADMALRITAGNVNWSGGTPGAGAMATVRGGTGANRAVGQIDFMINAPTGILVRVYSAPTTISGAYYFTIGSSNEWKNKSFLLKVEGNRLDIITDLVFTSASPSSGTGTPVTNGAGGGGYVTDLPNVGTGQNAMVLLTDNPLVLIADFEAYNLAELLLIDEPATIMDGPNQLIFSGTYSGVTPTADSGRAALQYQVIALQGTVVKDWTDAVDITASAGSWTATADDLPGGADYRVKFRKGNQTATTALTATPVAIPNPLEMSTNLGPARRYVPNDVFSNAMVRAEPRNLPSWSYDMTPFALDADQFPTVIPSGYRYLLLLPEYLRTGEWKIFYTPGTAFAYPGLNPNWTIISNDTVNGVITLTIDGVANQNDRQLEITALPPGGLNLLKMYKSSDIAAAGGDYNDVPMLTQHWIDSHAHYKTIRFMDWMQTNKNTVRPTLTAATAIPVTAMVWQSNASQGGYPIEAMIEVCNGLGADCWITPRHDADNSYYDYIATKLYTLLDPSLKVLVEYSNEVWNWGGSFQQTSDLVAQGNSTGQGYPIAGDPGSGPNNDYRAMSRQYAINHLNVLSRFATIFGADYEDRVIGVCGAQQGNGGAGGHTSFKLTISGYKEAIKRYATAPYMTMDAYTTLTGSALDDWMFGGWTDLEVAERLRILKYDMRGVSEQTDSAWKYVAYEGGQHWCQINSKVGNTEVMTKSDGVYQYDPRMKSVYERYIPAVMRCYGGKFCHFLDVVYPWGSAADESDITAPKYVALKDAS